VSLPWSKRIHMRLGPEAIEATFDPGEAGGKPWVALSRPCSLAAAASGASSVGAGAPSASGLPTALEDVLAKLNQRASLRGARLMVEVDDSLVHLDVVEGDFAGSSDRQLDAIAAASATELLGDGAAEHDLRWSLQAEGRHLLVCAMPRALVAAVSDAAGPRGINLASMQSSFARHWNAHGGRQRSSTAVFVVASRGHAVVACVVERSICAISSGPWIGPRAPKVGAALTTGTRDAAIKVLDAWVDRLLASLGIPCAAATVFTLVAPSARVHGTSPRWNLIDVPEAVA
jgi:hypothetical protein